MASLKTKVELYLGREFTDKECFITTAHETNWETKIVKWTIEEKSQPTQEELDALEAAATTADTNRNVRRTRRIAYGPVREQLDLLYKDMLADKGDKTGEWFKAVKKIKDDNPKS